MPDADDELHYMLVVLYEDVSDDEDSEEYAVYLFINEEAVQELVDASNASGEEGTLTWEYADAEEPAANTHEAYIVHVVDQDNNPVEGVMVNFCTDVACIPVESDEDGQITFSRAPDVYHVTIVDAPDGYSYDADYEMYTPRTYSEWVLRVKKD